MLFSVCKGLSIGRAYQALYPSHVQGPHGHHRLRMQGALCRAHMQGPPPVAHAGPMARHRPHVQGSLRQSRLPGPPSVAHVGTTSGRALHASPFVMAMEEEEPVEEAEGATKTAP